MTDTTNQSGTGTSEFKVFCAVGVFILFAYTPYVDVDSESMKWFLGFASAYIASRTAVKYSANKGILTAVMKAAKEP